MRRAPLLLLAALASTRPAVAQPWRADPTAHERDTAPSPSRPWEPPENVRARTAVTAPSASSLPAEWLKPGATLSLAELTAIALRTSPLTRASWFDAKAKAADVGVNKAAYYPEIDLSANVTRQKQTAVGGRFTTQQTTWGPAASLSYLLFDLGGRAADVEEAQNALYEANFAHDAVIQDLVLRVAEVYYQYLDAKALAAAAAASLEEASANLESAGARHDAGVATIADVLQARTARAQAQLALESAEGQIQTLRGAMATAIGVPATIPVDVGELPEAGDVDAAGEAMDRMIDRALSGRPDLLAARAEALKTRSHIRSVRSEGLPALSVNGNVNRTYFSDTEFASYANNYSGAVTLHFPLFTGFGKTEELIKAKAEAEAADARAETLAQKVILDVWTSSFAVKTAAQRVKTARALLESAKESAEVGAGRYKAGVGSILDLLTAQSALASARAQDAQARADWFIALAQLAHDTGVLGPELQGAPPAARKEER